MDLGAFRESAGIVDRTGRTILHFKGEQALWFVDQLLTNKVDDLEGGEGVDSLLLTPKGRIVAPMRLFSTGSSLFADTEPGRGEELKSFFDERVFTTQVEIGDRTSEFAILSVLGPGADEFVEKVFAERVAHETEEQRALGLSLPADREHHTVHYGAGVLVRVARPVGGIDVWVRSEQKQEVIDALAGAGAAVATEEQYSALCAFEGLPVFGVDFDATYLPQEAALERAVHFDKGCYLGQEAVAMAQRGRVARRIRRLRFSGPPLIGTVHFEGAEAGRVTSAAFEGGMAYGIATIKTSVPEGAEVEVREGTSVTGTVSEIPGAVAGPPAPSARELRERLQR